MDINLVRSFFNYFFKKSLFIVIIIFYLFISFKRLSLAAEPFSTSYKIQYIINENGITHASYEISLTNLLSNVYASQYSLTLASTNISSVSASDPLGPILPKISTEENRTNIELKFNAQVVGVNKTLTFKFQYQTPDFAQKNGLVWEINLPQLANIQQIDKLSTTLTIPSSFGQPAYLIPQPIQTKKTAHTRSYIYSQKELEKTNISAVFGKQQLYEFKLAYHLSNPNLTPAQSQIAIPPDTAYQTVILTDIKPKPIVTNIDADGNWIANFLLEPKEKLDVIARGYFQVYIEPKNKDHIYLTPPSSDYLKASKYWEVNDPQIQTLAQKYNTPQKIYDHITQTLKYHYGRVEEKTQRLGAKKALKLPQLAICMEYTDAFIALARAAGIPARELNGFAYTKNEQLRPSTRIVDTLHAWPEYYDKINNIWRPVDPTWGHTSHGIDYFNKLDLNHIVFVIHGQDSQKPYPAGSYKSKNSQKKDIEINFVPNPIDLSFYQQPKILVNFKTPDKLVPFFKHNGQIIVKNIGQTAIYNLEPGYKSKNISLSFDESVVISGEKLIAMNLAPQGEKIYNFTAKCNQWFRSKPQSLTLYISDNEYSKEFKQFSPLTLWILLLVLSATLILIFTKIIRRLYLSQR